MPRFARCVFAVFLAVSCLSSSLTCQAAAPETAAAAFILMEAGSGRVLASRNETQERSIASTTKIMTCILALEKGNPKDLVTASANAVAQPKVHLGMHEGEAFYLGDLLYSLMLESHNDTAAAIAEHVAGSVEAFAGLMNEKAAELGCTDSHFANPSGLNDPNHYVSAYDMALIAKAAFNNPTFVEVDSTTYYDVPAGKLKQYPDGWRYYAHHRMLRRNDSLYYDLSLIHI